MEMLAGSHCVREALRARRRRLRRLWLRTPAPRGVAEVLDLAEAAGVAIEWVPEAVLAEMLPPGARSQGLVLEAEALPELDLDEALARPLEGPPLWVALDEVEDPQNVGAIARVAEAAGAHGLILARRRAPPISPAVSRASAGAVEHLPVIRVPNLPRALHTLGAGGCWRIGADGAPEVEPHWAAWKLWTAPAVLVLGSEEHGLRPGVRREIDHLVRVPMRGRVASLNVAAAAAVLLFDAARSRYEGLVPGG